MNIYNDEAVFLSEESTRDFVYSLLFDQESLSRRDAFVCDIASSLTFEDDGERIVLDVPDIKLSDDEIYRTEKKILTKKIDVTIAATLFTNIYQCGREMQACSINIGKSTSKYNVCSKKTDKEWITNVPINDNVA